VRGYGGKRRHYLKFDAVALFIGGRAAVNNYFIVHPCRHQLVQQVGHTYQEES
jgi:hypothetical protein